MDLWKSLKLCLFVVAISLGYALPSQLKVVALCEGYAELSMVEAKGNGMVQSIYNSWNPSI
jgi:uncharacterized membrane protein (Fun14 family)